MENLLEMNVKSNHVCEPDGGTAASPHTAPLQRVVRP
jgi:hypothetical protein